MDDDRIDDWYVQERFPTEDCLLYPERCADCIAERKQCLLNLFTLLNNQSEQEETPPQDRGKHNDKPTKQIKKSKEKE